MRVIATLVAVGAMLAQAVPASATELIVLSVDDVRYGQPGDVVEVASAQVPADLVGQECRVIGRASNQESVHPGNDLLIVSGDQVVEITDFEDGEFAVSEVGEIEVLPAEISVFLRFGVDGVSSGGFTVFVECEDPPATTTTAPATTTTAPTTTAPTTTAPTTTAPATTETVAPTTTTVAPSSTTVSVLPPETTASTGVSATSLGETNIRTSTTAPPPAGPVITGTPSSNEQPTGSKLPITGNALTSAVFGFSLFAAGRLLHQVSRRLTES